MSDFLKNFAEKLKGEMGTAEQDILPSMNRAPINQKILEVVELLESDPLLIEPTRRFIVQKIREMNGAKISALYSPEEIEEMKKQLP